MVMDGLEGMGDIMDGCDWQRRVCDIAFANYFYVCTLYMEYCAHQHAKSPLWPMNKLGTER